MKHQDLDDAHINVVQERRVQERVLSVIAVQLGNIVRQRLAIVDNMFDRT
jgi:hypothetical protein